MFVEVCGVGKNYYAKYLKGNKEELPSYEELLENEGGVLVDGVCVKTGHGYDMEKLLDIKNGDRIEYDMDQGSGSFLVMGRGMFSDKSYEKQNEYDLVLVLPEEVFHKYLKPSITLGYLNAVPGKEQKLREWLRENKEDYGVFVGDYVSEYLQAKNTNDMTELVLFYVLLLIIAISAVHIGNTVIYRIQVKREDYSLMRVLGMRLFSVRLRICGEAVLAVFLACLFGMLLGGAALKKMMEIFLQIRITSVSIPLKYLVCAGNVMLLLSFATAFLVSGVLKKHSIAQELKSI